MAAFKAEPRGEKSAKGTKSHSTSAFLLCQQSPISAGNPQIFVAENRAGFHWASVVLPTRRPIVSLPPNLSLIDVWPILYILR